MPFDAFVFDLDGTIYLGDEPLPGAVAALAALRAAGRRVAFASNNPLRSPEAYAGKLRGMGIACDPADVVTSVTATVRYFSACPGRRRVFALAESGVLEALTGAGCAIVEDSGEADFVLVSWDRAFNYDKLDLATRALLRGARLIATHPDPACPVRGGVGRVPDAGALLAAVEASSGVRREAVCGKPSRWMAACLLDRLQVAPERVLVVGDRVETDMALALDNGMGAALVLTGVSTEADAARMRGRVRILPSAAAVADGV